METTISTSKSARWMADKYEEMTAGLISQDAYNALRTAVTEMLGREFAEQMHAEAMPLIAAYLRGIKDAHDVSKGDDPYAFPAGLSDAERVRWQDGYLQERGQMRAELERKKAELYAGIKGDVRDGE